MLSKLFEKEKPILILAVGLFMSVFFFYYTYIHPTAGDFKNPLYITLLLWGLYLFTMLLIDFIGRKNNIAKNKSYKILLFALFTTAIPETFLYEKTFLSFFLVVLALRRIISLPSGIDIQKKIFDAALWISLASCFYFWSALFFIVLYAGIFIFSRENYRNWFIPFTGMGVVILFSNVYTLLVQNAFYTPLDWIRPAEFDFLIYSSFKYIVPLTLYAALLVWSLFDLFINWKQKKLKNKQLTSLLLCILVISLTVVLFTHQKNGSELVFFVFPFAALFSNYLSFAKDYVFKEILLWILLLLPFLIPFLK